MRYHALATDYDGTIASHNTVSEETVQALRRLRPSGRKLILVTGRELGDLLHVFPHPELFDRIVAENGALLYRPATRQEQPLGQPPPPQFVERLRERGVGPLSVGRVIVATVEPNETAVLQVIRELGLELQVIFNKGAVMILPSGVNKATGLGAALKDLGLSRHNVVGVGDAENDHAFLEFCECGVAVANALPALKQHADLVTKADHGAGVSSLIDQMIDEDLRSLEPKLTRHEIQIGQTADGQAVRIKPYGSRVLITGESSSGNSLLVTSFLEAVIQRRYQTCIVDPAGDYPQFEKAVVFGDRKQAPSLEAVMKAFDQARDHVILNLVGSSPAGRLTFFRQFMEAVTALRVRTGRPHWVFVDEAQEVLAGAAAENPVSIPDDGANFVFVTARPAELMPPALAAVNLVIASGEAARLVTEFAQAAHRRSPTAGPDPESGEYLGWQCSRAETFAFRVAPRGLVREGPVTRETATA